MHDKFYFDVINIKFAETPHSYHTTMLLIDNKLM